AFATGVVGEGAGAGFAPSQPMVARAIAMIHARMSRRPCAAAGAPASASGGRSTLPVGDLPRPGRDSAVGTVPTGLSTGIAKRRDPLRFLPLVLRQPRTIHRATHCLSAAS